MNKFRKNFWQFPPSPSPKKMLLLHFLFSKIIWKCYCNKNLPVEEVAIAPPFASAGFAENLVNPSI